MPLTATRESVPSAHLSLSVSLCGVCAACGFKAASAGLGLQLTRATAAEPIIIRSAHSPHMIHRAGPLELVVLRFILL